MPKGDGPSGSLEGRRELETVSAGAEGAESLFKGARRREATVHYVLTSKIWRELSYIKKSTS